MTSDSNYNMKLPDDDFDDSNIYATDVVMLKVREKGASNRVIHDVVKANYSVRPLEFCKESEEKIQSDYQILLDQINNIEPFVVNVNGRDLKVFMRISPTMWDGKSDSAIIKHKLKIHHKDQSKDVSENGVLQCQSTLEPSLGPST